MFWGHTLLLTASIVKLKVLNAGFIVKFDPLGIWDPFSNSNEISPVALQPGSTPVTFSVNV